VGPRAVLDAVVKRKITSPRRKSNPITPMVQPVPQRYHGSNNIRYRVKIMKLLIDFRTANFNFSITAVKYVTEMLPSSSHEKAKTNSDFGVAAAADVLYVPELTHIKIVRLN
jgi:hypothetical protein